MGSSVLQSDSVLRKSPFLVVKQLAHDEVRAYSKLHGNLTSFDFDIHEVLDVFDSPIDVDTAVKKVSAIRRDDSSRLIEELYEKRFLVEEGRNDEDLFREYIGIVRSENQIPKISKITFLTSAQCNLACKGCYHHFFDFKSADMNAGLADQILEGAFPYLKRRAIPALLISFLGYEPLLNFETLTAIFDRACTLTQKYGIETSFKLFTNAFSLSEKIYGWMAQNKSRLGIMVSLDGVREDHDQRRVDVAGRGTHDRVVENLKRIIATDIECRVLTVLSKLNLANIERFVDEMAALGVKGVTANLFCGHSPEERRIELTETQKFEALRRMDRATERYGIEFDGEWKFAVLQMITGAHFSCPAGMKQLVFSADGTIYPCQRFAGTTRNFGRYDEGFWNRLSDGQCADYNHWTADLYEGVADRIKDEETDLTGWGCPFVPFIRGECIGRNLDRALNENLLEYYLTRPLNRVLTKSPINY